MADTLLKCTTRHVRLFTARVENDDLVPSGDELTLDLDPDNEFLWSDAVVTKVQQRFQQLVEAGAGGELSDYSLRRIGTDLEGYIRCCRPGNSATTLMEGCRTSPWACPTPDLL